LFCSVHQITKTKNPNLGSEYKNAVLGYNSSYNEENLCDAHQDTFIRKITDGINYIFLFDKVPFFDHPDVLYLIYPAEHFPIRDSAIDNEIINLFTKQP
jgi:hypothetical protein